MFVINDIMFKVFVMAIAIDILMFLSRRYIENIPLNPKVILTVFLALILVALFIEDRKFYSLNRGEKNEEKR